MSAPAPPLTPQSFFSQTWRGRGSVSALFGRTLRTFAVEFRGAWTEAEKGYVLEETVAYDDGQALARSWHISADARGALVGLEASQGGRMFVQAHGRGFRLRYDRLRFLPGPNVTRVVLEVRARPDGSAEVAGWTRVLGLPLLRTRIVCTTG